MAQRSPVRLTMSYKVPSTRKAYRVLTREVGDDGLSFVSEQPLDQNDLLEAELILPDRPAPIVFSAQVRFCQPATGGKDFHVDVRFTTIDPKHLALIKQFVAVNAIIPPM